ncbi:MAG: hypothetical protein HYZ91_04175, partial [Candidatus Omnitrophica bacterium]|nr:hypothetical protein [Candidatus Omnitrophota bacterium]
QVQREKDALERLLARYTSGRRTALQEGLARAQGASAPLADSPHVGTLDTVMAQAKQRYQDLLNQRARVQLSVATWSQPSSTTTTTFRNLTLLDEALPPSVRWPRLWMMALAVAAICGLAGLAMMPVLLGLLAVRSHGARLAIHGWCERLMPIPLAGSLSLSADGNGAAPAHSSSVNPPVDFLARRSRDDTPSPG